MIENIQSTHREELRSYKKKAKPAVNHSQQKRTKFLLEQNFFGILPKIIEFSVGA